MGSDVVSLFSLADKRKIQERNKENNCQCEQKRITLNEFFFRGLLAQVRMVYCLSSTSISFLSVIIINWGISFYSSCCYLRNGRVRYKVHQGKLIKTKQHCYYLLLLLLLLL